MSNIGSYDERVKNFSWSIAEKELGYKPGDVINIGWYCTDRPCAQGKADKIALYWEGFTGAEKTYTYNDIRLASNTIAAFLRSLGIKPGERVCLFLDRVPELYLGFLGILKTGAIAQPLFSAFGDESLLVRLSNAETTAVITQKKHAPKVRKILDKMPHLRHIIVVDHDGVARSGTARSPSRSKRPLPSSISTSTRRGPSRPRSSTTPRARRACPRASSTSTIPSSPST
jgi:acetyl-CoA synthetase